MTGDPKATYKGLAEAANKVAETAADKAAVQETAADEAGLQIDYGSSKLYTQEDMDEAIALIQEKFGAWEGCELHSISYAGDECNSKENIRWLRSLSYKNRITECICFESAFHSPVEAGGAWAPDHEYTGWQCWLGRTDGGSWKLLSWGY